jgi:hypothetical protein
MEYLVVIDKGWNYLVLHSTVSTNKMKKHPVKKMHLVRGTAQQYKIRFHERGVSYYYTTASQNPSTLHHAAALHRTASTRLYYSLRDPLSLSVALGCPPYSSASSAFSTFSLMLASGLPLLQSSSSVPDIIAASESKTPTPYRISSTPHQPQRVSSSTEASQLVPCAVSGSQIPNHIFLSASAITCA